MAEQGLHEELAGRLLHWYGANARELPWRARNGAAADPYRVWLSEIMLQQTTVAAVKGYYRKFLARWPTLRDLAAAPLDDVLKAWAGLGYYARARNLHACAKAVADKCGGVFPDTEAGLRALPGIGAYTAAAVAAIAFGRPAAAIDGNAERVIARLHAITTPLPAARPEIHARTLELVPAQRPGDFAQALMDLGATICTPRAPNCLLCPWMAHCEARRQGIAETLPRKRPRRAIPTRKAVAFWIESEDGRVLLRRRPEKGLLGGMMEVPSTPWQADLPPDPAAHAPVKTSWLRTGLQVVHTFTHFRLELELWRTEAPVPPAKLPDESCRWIAQNVLFAEALPTVMRNVVEKMLEESKDDDRLSRLLKLKGAGRPLSGGRTAEQIDEDVRKFRGDD